MLQNFSFDWISYLIGLLSGLAIWLVISQSRIFFPQLIRWINQKSEEFKQHRLAGAEGEIRQSTYIRSQKSHIGSFLCELDAILVTPCFLSPPAQSIPGSTPAPESFSDQLIPYLPFHPEFTAALSPHRLTFQQLLSSRVNIAVVGMPGSGKSTALAFLASRLSNSKYSDEKFPSLLPIYLHVHDLNLSSQPENPLAHLVSILQQQVTSSFTKQVLPTLLTAIHNKKAILILDGFDELHPAVELPLYSNFIHALFMQNPDLHMVVSANPHHLNGLVSSGFSPFALAPFSRDDNIMLLEKWLSLWKMNFASEKTSFPELDIRLQKYWIKNLPGKLNPLEATLRIISMLSGDLQQGHISYSGIETFLSRVIGSDQDRLVVESLAARFILTEHSATSSATFTEWINQGLPSQTKSTSNQSPSAETPIRLSKSGPSLKSEKKTPVSQLMDRLLDSNIIKKYSSGRIGFSHPQLLGYLAAFALPVDLPQPMFENLYWTANSETLHYLVTQGENDLWIDTLLRLEDRPLYWIHFTVGRWLKDTPLNSVWRGNFLRQVVTLINKENFPFSIRADLYTILLQSADPSVSAVVKQLLSSNSVIIRRLSAMAAGYLEATGMLDNLLDLITDQNPEVSLSAVLALGAFDTNSAREICIDILVSAGELERRAAAEALLQSRTGLEFLIKALGNDDLMVRRASVHGLSKFQTPEIIKLLEKVSVEDGQWIVRTAASEALDWANKPDYHLPFPLSEPSDTPWLISFTSKSGTVLSKGQAVIPIFLEVLKSGAPEERLRAIDYLTQNHDEGVINNLYNILYGSSEVMSRSASQALWLISAAGVTLPSPTKFGFS